jgi:hypothetical protein
MADPCFWHYLIIVCLCVLLMFVDAAYRRTRKYLEQRNMFLLATIGRLNEEITYNRFRERAENGGVVNGGKSEIKVDEEGRE